MDALITVEGVEKDFGNQVKALDQVNLEIASGDIYGIIGMSGAGKSTLVRCLNYLEKPTAGVCQDSWQRFIDFERQTASQRETEDCNDLSAF